LPLSRRIWARLQLLPAAPAALDDGGLIRFHQGTCERSGRLRPLGSAEDGSLQVEIVLDHETVLLPGDRFIIRRPAPVDTVGGGVVVDVNPPRGKSGLEAAFASDSLEIEQATMLRLERAKLAGLEPAALALQLGLSAARMADIAAGLEDAERLVIAGPVLLDAAAWNRLKVSVREEVKRFHAREPLRSGLSREDLRASLAGELPQEAWRRLLEEMAAEGALALDGELVALAGHEVVLSGEELEMAERIEDRFRRAGLEPPAPGEAISAKERVKAEKILDLLVAKGALVRIRDGKLFHAEALDSLIAKLRDHAAGSETIDVAGFKKLAGVTRKNAIPLLEHLDDTRVTRRKGNLRVILLSRP
jgi:selenocysteine-specific elongation factor